MAEPMIRCGTCSRCGIALESPGGVADVEQARPRSRAVRRSGHCKSGGWRISRDSAGPPIADGAAARLPGFV